MCVRFLCSVFYVQIENYLLGLAIIANRGLFLKTFSYYIPSADKKIFNPLEYGKSDIFFKSIRLVVHYFLPYSIKLLDFQ